jgi:7,8-dihydropterin-6-yl-methyl-4-(beta-D-ribofuranosyl)aminobenzene 5'-phosphate synthase
MIRAEKVNGGRRMKIRTSLIAFILIGFTGFAARSVRGANITMTVLYDNTVFQEGTLSGWGFSCFIDGAEKTILFDTGESGSSLMKNIETLGIDLEKLDLIVISHNHADHTGGLNTVLDRNSHVSVYFGQSFPQSFGQNITDKGANPVLVDEPIEICRGVYSTGEIQGVVNEQSIIFDTDSGLVVITGCAHPGILNILNEVKEIRNKEIYLVFGGFHLLNFSDEAINEVIEGFRTLGVKKCGGTHCTGDRAIELFQAAYGDDYIPMGTGKVVQVSTTLISAKEESDEKLKIPTRVKLNQNFPNPFNPETTIGFNIPKTGYVTLSVYNLKGQTVDMLINEVLSAGPHSAGWDGSDHQAGVYLYALQTESHREVRKLALIR